LGEITPYTEPCGMDAWYSRRHGKQFTGTEIIEIFYELIEKF
jgi:hypothetical protein